MARWRILGIEPTKDITKIKAAYARRAKEWHPEEHPEEFKRLREAYREAIQYAKSDMNYGRPGDEIVSLRKEIPPKRSDKLRQEAALLKRERPKVSVEKEAKQEPVASVKVPVEEETKREPVKVQKVPVKAKPKRLTIEPVKTPEYEKSEENAFDYKEVELIGEQSRLLCEFRWIAWNPYLMNSIECWDYLFDREPWKTFLRIQAFREQLVALIMQLDGWKRATLLFLKKKMKEYGGKIKISEWLQMEYEAFIRTAWEKQQYILTAEDENMQKELLKQLKERRIPVDLRTRKALEAYLPLYFSYVASMESIVEKRYDKRKRERNSKVSFKVAFCIIGVLLCAGLFELFSEPQKTSTEELIEEVSIENRQVQMELILGKEEVSEELGVNLNEVMKLWEARETPEKGILLDNGYYFIARQKKDEYGNCVTHLEVQKSSIENNSPETVNTEENILAAREKIIIFEMQDFASYLKYTWQGEEKIGEMFLNNGVHYYIEKEENGETTRHVILEEEANNWIVKNILEQIKG